MKRVFILFLLILLCSSVLLSQPIRSKDIDKLVNRVTETFNVPGIAVAVIEDDRIVHMKGYGVSSLATGKKTDENTLFAIASNSKAFTAAALAILIDEGRLTWETKVIDIIPEFRLYNEYVTADFNITDLLTHRSGMGLGAGDLMLWPDSSTFTREEIIHNLRYLRQVSSFRTKYDYDNLLYIVAGEVVSRVSGQSWEQFIEDRIMQPLGMDRSSASLQRAKDYSNIIDAHVPVDGVLQVVPKYYGEILNPAGGIISSVSDMSKWVIMQLNGGRFGENNNSRLFSEKVHREMWTPVTLMPVSVKNPYKSHFSAYGLGWNLTNAGGFLQVSHTGGLNGIVTQVTMIPEIKLGIIVFTNQQESAAYNSITNTIKDAYLGVRGNDWVDSLYESLVQRNTNARKVTDEIWAKVESHSANTDIFIDHSVYTGIYTDTWLGDIHINSIEGRLRFRSVRSPGLRGDMFYYTGNTFVVKWDDRYMDADAFVIFTLDREGKAISFTMEPVSPLTDFSYDFHDLSPARKKEKK